MRRRNMPSVNSSGAQARQLSAGKNPLPPPVSTRTPTSLPMPQATGSGHETANPIKPGGSLHRAGTLHVSKGRMPKYNP